ncbi:MAG TPA: cysteine desulfurase family protein [Candidatus Binatia bacterium]|nr:cysteine desulfurase family protein [Candidatus Binatia bacterium]
MENDSPRRIYMDYSAGKPVDPRVTDAMLPFFTSSFGNPSSVHTLGQEAKQALQNSREVVAKLINSETPEAIVFTSGATESNNLAIRGTAGRNKSRGNKILTSSVEHMSVVNPCKLMIRNGFQVIFLPVDKFGVLDLEKLESELDAQTTLVSIVYANPEIGTVEPIKEISKIVHAKKAFLHVDATAACGQVPIDVQDENIDLLTMSSNDMYGPKGVGALYIKPGTTIEPVNQGGGQERGLRSGSENVPGIVGFAKAAEIAKNEMAKESQRLTLLRNNLIKGLIEPIPYSFINGHPTQRLPDNVSVRYSFIEGESILLSLDIMGVYASSGSACAAKTLQPSHVLLALGLQPEDAHGSLMATLGRENTQEDVDKLTSIMPDIVKRLRDMSPLTPKELK